MRELETQTGEAKRSDLSRGVTTGRSSLPSALQTYTLFGSVRLSPRMKAIRRPSGENFGWMSKYRGSLVMLTRLVPSGRKSHKLGLPMRGRVQLSTIHPGRASALPAAEDFLSSTAD